jgi:hypothetical protein
MTTDDTYALTLTDIDHILPLPAEYDILQPGDLRNDNRAALRAVRHEASAQTHYFYSALEYFHFAVSIAPRQLRIRFPMRPSRPAQAIRFYLTFPMRTSSTEGDGRMNARKRRENTHVPDDADTRVSPHEPMQRETLHHFLHVQSRGNASSTGMFSVDSRLPPSVSQVPPALPRRFPSFGQAHMLQPSVGPCDRVRIHPVMWVSIEAPRQEKQA